jgi:hypothetical protein
VRPWQRASPVPTGGEQTAAADGLPDRYIQRGFDKAEQLRRLSDFEVLANLRDLLTATAHVVNAQRGQPIPPGEGWRNDAQATAVKLFRHLHTVRELCDLKRFSLPGGAELPFVDHSSATVVTRAALETFLVFSHVYGAEDGTLAEFRHAQWKLAGLTDRQEMIALSADNRRKLKEEGETVEVLREAIARSPHFAARSPNHQAALLEGKWRVGLSWTDLGVAAGFGRKFFANTYSFLCGHSHCSWASVLQVRDSLDSIPDQRSLTGSLAGVAAMADALFIESYCRAFPMGGAKLLTDDTARFLVDRWTVLARGVSDLYDAHRDD